MDRAQSLQSILDARHADHPALIIELSRRYLAHWPDDRHALRAYADALTSIARYPEAHAAYDRALPLAETEAQRGSLYSALGHLAQAQADIQETVIRMRCTTLGRRASGCRVWWRAVRLSGYLRQLT